MYLFCVYLCVGLVAAEILKPNVIIAGPSPEKFYIVYQSSFDNDQVHTLLPAIRTADGNPNSRFVNKLAERDCTGKPYFRIKQLSTVTNQVINEVSGMGASRTHPNILYVHNDSGDGPYIYAINAETGVVKSTITIKDAVHRDWEDMAYGVCPDHTQDYCIYIGDFGGNIPGGARDVIYRVREPADLQQSLEVDIDATINFTWTETNCEIMMVDPTGEIYLVSKNIGSPGKIAHVPRYAWNNQTVNLTDLTPLSFFSQKPNPTGGDLSPDGTEIVIISTDNLYYWNVSSGEYLHILAAAPMHLKYKDEPQGEAVCWDPSGSGFYTLSEGLNQPIYYYERVYSPSSQAHIFSRNIALLLAQITLILYLR